MRKLSVIPPNRPAARPSSCLPTVKPRSLYRFAWIHEGRSILGLLWSIFGLFRSVFAENGMFCSQIIGFLCFRTFLKASRASPVCILPRKSHTHPPRVPPPRSLVRSFSKIFLFFFTMSVNECKLPFYDLVLFMNAVVYGFCCFCRSYFCVLLCVVV